jgi:hypothetical protein
LIAALIAETNSDIFPASMQANLRMQKLLQKLFRKSEFPKELPRNLKEILNAGFVRRGGCLLLAWSADRSFGGKGMDRTGYECFVNHIHIANFPHAWLYANELSKKLKLSRSGECAVIVSFDGNDATVRFHKRRPGPAWCAEDLEGYREEAVAILRTE